MSKLLVHYSFLPHVVKRAVLFCRLSFVVSVCFEFVIFDGKFFDAMDEL